MEADMKRGQNYILYWSTELLLWRYLPRNLQFYLLCRVTNFCSESRYKWDHMKTENDVETDQKKKKKKMNGLSRSHGDHTLYFFIFQYQIQKSERKKYKLSTYNSTNLLTYRCMRHVKFTLCSNMVHWKVFC